MTEPRVPASPKRASPGRASRFLAAGGAVGVGLLMVGGMASAADHPQDPAPAAAPATQPIIVVVVEPVTTPSPSVPAEPVPLPSEQPMPALQPVAESHGS